MYRSISFSLCAALMVCASVSAAEKYGIGSTASQAEIAGWDIDVRPDGQGLPDGSGSVADGEFLYEEQCASCHGVFGEGEGRWPVLAGGLDSLTEDRPEKTVGSYWPFASTLWDYIHRAMPFLQPQTLEDDEVYAITAYVLYLNELVEDDFVLTKENFTSIKMPNEVAFVDDPRPDINNTRCMKNCKEPGTVKVVQDSTELGVTPVEHLADQGIADQKPSSQGEETYKAACGVCHDSGVAGAPSMGDEENWQARLKQGIDVLYEHAINGYQGSSGYMPAKGGNSSLEDQAVKAAVDYMVGSANP